MKPNPKPTAEELEKILDEAFSVVMKRYGLPT